MNKQRIIKIIERLIKTAESRKVDYDSRLFYDGAIASLKIILEEIESMED